MTQDGKTLVLGDGQVRVCAICAAYAAQRGPRIRAEIRRTTPAEQRLDRWAAFMAGVHARHLDLARSNLRAYVCEELYDPRLRRRRCTGEPKTGVR